MTYGSETRPLLCDGLNFEIAEMQMIRWMCGIYMKYKSEGLSRLVGVESITTVIRSGRLRWDGHVMRTGEAMYGV